MVIDFHTHIFPDELAKRAVSSVASNSQLFNQAVHDGTAAGLLKNMDDWGIDTSVVLPVVTKQSQTRQVNEWAAGICSDRLVCFGGIFPHTDDYKRDIDLVVSCGLKGIKLHPEYQRFPIDEPRMLKLYDYAFSKGLILMFHAGLDRAFPPPFHSSPMRFAKVADEMKGGVIVAAHLGGAAQWGDVETFLAGKDIYLDTSMGFDYYSTEQFMRIFEKHGADRILFGSDAPWSSAKSEIEKINALAISDDEKNAILYGNAAKLLGLSG